jgi:hypothetical protein
MVESVQVQSATQEYPQAENDRKRLHLQHIVSQGLLDEARDLIGRSRAFVEDEGGEKDRPE